MKLFKDRAEIRLTREDLFVLLQEALNDNVRSSCKSDRYVIDLTLHPRNKYVARVTISTTKPKT